MADQVEHERARATAWTGDHLQCLAAAPLPLAPVIAPANVRRLIPGVDLWDFWPVQTVDGAVAPVSGGALWMALSAPASSDPIERHACARIRLFWVVDGDWRDLGPVLPDGFGLGSREWSGSALLQGDELRLFYTAAGRQGERRLGWAQRLIQTTARLRFDGSTPRLSAWTMPRVIVESDCNLYDPADQEDGRPGEVKAFRDPAYFRDAEGAAWLLFAASLGHSGSPWNGAVGLARAAAGDLERWVLLPPIVTAEDVANELERPHAVCRDGLVYVFWSTLASVFAPALRAPTGLYGAVGQRITGPFELLNGSGLVIANPPAAPEQAYSWLVGNDWTVSSFANQLGREPASAGFAGALAPQLRLVPDGARIHLSDA